MQAQSKAAQPLRGRLVRRLPSSAELARRTPIVLTKRDQALLAMVYKHGFLTTDLIELVFFPPPPDGRSSPASRAYERIRQLWLWSFLDRIELPVARIAGGRRPFLYALGKRGAPVVAAFLGKETAPVQRRRLDRLDDLFIEHDLKAAALWAWAHLRALLRRTRARGIRWTPERDLRARKARVKDPQTNRWLPVLPDAYFEVDYPDGTVQSCLLEVDMGSLTLARFRRKLRAFELYLAQGLFEKHWRRDCFEVMVLTHSLARLKHLGQAARQELSRDRWSWYFFATFEILDPTKFGGDVWINLEGEWSSLLYPEAFEDGSAVNDGSTEE
jgi:hypothetical protein